MKITAIAPSNVALIKYWGKKNEKLRLPLNGTVSVNLSNLLTKTTVEFSSKYKEDDIVINRRKNLKEIGKVVKHLDRVRKMANINEKAKVVSLSNFPPDSGLASSASGFAALTLAAAKSAGLNLSKRELSILSRIGSGSACRSIPDGFAEWKKGSDSDTSYAVSIFPSDYWAINFIAVIIKGGIKNISSTSGQEIAKTSPFLKERLNLIDGKIKKVKKFIREKNFKSLGEIVEADALELHAIALTSRPSIIYWEPGTVKVMKLIQELRKKGMPCYFTIDAGYNVYVVCERKNIRNIIRALKKIEEVERLIVNAPGRGAYFSSKHLF